MDDLLTSCPALRQWLVARIWCLQGPRPKTLWIGAKLEGFGILFWSCSKSLFFQNILIFSFAKVNSENKEVENVNLFATLQ